MVAHSAMNFAPQVGELGFKLAIILLIQSFSSRLFILFMIFNFFLLFLMFVGFYGYCFYACTVFHLLLKAPLGMAEIL